VPDDEDTPAPEARQPIVPTAPTDNERRRRAAARLFAVARPSVATRLQWIEQDAAGFVRQLESGQKTDIADMRRWEERARFVCHTILAEPPPPSLDRLTNSRFAWRGGRPSSRDLVRLEAQRRLDVDTVPATLKQFGNELSMWLAANHPGAPRMVGRVVERNIRALWPASGRK